MSNKSKRIRFARLPDIPVDEIIAHMSDPVVTAHMPLATEEWDEAYCAKFVAAKQAFWERDGLGHWAILFDEKYVGWGGFQLEGQEWDFGLVLKPEYFGLGMMITRKALEFAKSDPRIPHVTFLLPPTRKKLGALQRMGAHRIGVLEIEGREFIKFCLSTK